MLRPRSTGVIANFSMTNGTLDKLLSPKNGTLSPTPDSTHGQDVVRGQGYAQRHPPVGDKGWALNLQERSLGVEFART
jgi:hypothetical protein